MFKTSKLLYVGLLALLVLFANDFSVKQPTDTIAVDAPFISNVAAFSFELAGNQGLQSEAWVDDWFFNQEAPFKYRVLGKIPIFASYQVLKFFGVTPVLALYYAYLFWAVAFIMLFLLAATALVNKLARQITGGENSQTLFVTTASLIALCAPVLFAFKFPVHGSPNDFLGYALIALSLLALLNKKYYAFLIFCVLGVFCRETNLVVLAPFVLLKEVSIQKKVVFTLVTLTVFSLFKILWPGSYNPLSGAAHNTKYMLESLLFLFLVFGPIGFLAIFGYAKFFKQLCHNKQHDLLRALHISFIPVCVFVIFVVFMFARVREIRIEFILFFYVFPYAIAFLLTGFKSQVSRIKPIFILLLILTAALGSFMVLLQLTPATALGHKQLANQLAHFYTGFGGGWVRIFIVYSFVTLVLLGLMLLSKIKAVQKEF